MAILFHNDMHMRTPLRATVLVGLLALMTVFIKPVQSAGPATKIVVEPATVSITADQTQTFKVLAVAADGTSTDVTTQSTLSTNDPLGKMSGAVYTPGKVGSWILQASYQSFTATATTIVTAGAVKEVVINPNSEPEQAFLGTTIRFSATAYDAKNNVVPSQTIVWTVTGENGSIDNQGIFTPTKIGTGKVQATAGAIVGQVSIVVNPAIVTNTNSVTNSAINTNAPKNTNAANANTSTNSSTNTPVTATTTSEKSTSCTTLKPWAWIMLMILFLVGVAVLFALVPVTRIWPVVVALGAAVVLAYVQRTYDCNSQAWWAWIVMLGTIALASAALMMRPKNTPTV